MLNKKSQSQNRHHGRPQVQPSKVGPDSNAFLSKWYSEGHLLEGPPISWGQRWATKGRAETEKGPPMRLCPQSLGAKSLGRKRGFPAPPLSAPEAVGAGRTPGCCAVCPRHVRVLPWHRAEACPSPLGPCPQSRLSTRPLVPAARWCLRPEGLETAPQHVPEAAFLNICCAKR